MLDWTDRHCRSFHRQLSRHARLYTEMVTTGALLHGDRSRFRFDDCQHPVALQLGGCEPDALARCAELAAAAGFDEINLNCGCPSDRVQDGGFGACLMSVPNAVAASVAAMRNACDLPVTVKCRIGIDLSEDYQFFRAFIEPVAAAGCRTFIVHARKAWLSGLSPKENREIPPLRYDIVYRLKREMPELTIVINGGIQTLAECEQHLRHVDGVMLGRAVYENPFLLAEVDQRLFGDSAEPPTRNEVLARLRPLVERELAAGEKLSSITRHILGLYRGLPGGRGFRRTLSELAHLEGADWSVIEQAVAHTAPRELDGCAA
jgi:tRNA-dihydrouridine synthase A